MPSASHLDVQSGTLSANLNNVRTEINLLLKIRLGQSATSWFQIQSVEACCAFSRLIQVCFIVYQLLVLVDCNLTAREGQIVEALAYNKHVFWELLLRLNLKVFIAPYTLGLVLIDTPAFEESKLFLTFLALLRFKTV